MKCLKSEKNNSRKKDKKKVRLCGPFLMRNIKLSSKKLLIYFLKSFIAPIECHIHFFSLKSVNKYFVSIPELHYIFLFCIFNVYLEFYLFFSSKQSEWKSHSNFDTSLLLRLLDSQNIKIK